VSTQTASTTRSPLFSALVGLVTLGVLLQGLWAGIFLEHDGKRDAADDWIDVHAVGGYITVILAVAATVVALIQLRQRRDLWIGSIVLTVLLLLEIGFGNMISDGHKDAVTAVHVPVALLIMAVAVWLPLRARQRG
jgi:hypothetical protein